MNRRKAIINLAALSTLVFVRVLPAAEKTVTISGKTFVLDSPLVISGIQDLLLDKCIFVCNFDADHWIHIKNCKRVIINEPRVIGWPSWNRGDQAALNDYTLWHAEG